MLLSSADKGATTSLTFFDLPQFDDIHQIERRKRVEGGYIDDHWQRVGTWFERPPGAGLGLLDVRV